MAALDGHDRGQYGRGFIPQSFWSQSPGVPFGLPPHYRAAADAILQRGACPRLLGRFSPRHGRGGRPFGPPNNRARPCRISKSGSAAHSAGLPYPLSRFPFSLRERGKAVGLRHPLRRGLRSRRAHLPCGRSIMAAMSRLPRQPCRPDRGCSVRQPGHMLRP